MIATGMAGLSSIDRHAAPHNAEQARAARISWIACALVAATGAHGPRFGCGTASSPDVPAGG